MVSEQRTLPTYVLARKHTGEHSHSCKSQKVTSCPPGSRRFFSKFKALRSNFNWKVDEDKIEHVDKTMRSKSFLRHVFRARFPLNVEQSDGKPYYFKTGREFIISWSCNKKEDGTFEPLPLWKNFLGKFRLLAIWEKITGRKSYTHYELNANTTRLTWHYGIETEKIIDPDDKEGKKTTNRFVRLTGEKVWYVHESPTIFYVEREKLDKKINIQKEI